jgi:hypothetical protein
VLTGGGRRKRPLKVCSSDMEFSFRKLFLPIILNLFLTYIFFLKAYNKMKVKLPAPIAGPEPGMVTGRQASQ